MSGLSGASLDISRRSSRRASVRARRTAPLSAFADRISLVYATAEAGPSALTVDMASASEAVAISATATGCPGAGLCGFTDGTRALVVDTSGVGAGHDFFTVTGTAGALAHDAPNPAFHRPYAAGRSLVVPVVQRVYYFDRAARRLMVYDGHQSDMPFIDNVVDVRFEYFADRAASSVAQPPEGMSSCVFDAGPASRSRASTISAATDCIRSRPAR